MLGEFLENVRRTSPLIHCITNYVTANDCANILLAVGASPIMADCPDEAEEISALSSALYLNIGTLNGQTIPAMLAAGKRAAALSHPVLLDPVGAGASKLRTETARELLKSAGVSVVRGNVSEIKALFSSGTARGVDVSESDKIGADELESAAALVKGFAQSSGCIIAATGETDIITDGEKVFTVRNGHPMLGKITGAGCMLGAVMAAFLAANPENKLSAAAAAVCAFGLCGEKAAAARGSGSFRVSLIDEASLLTAKALEDGAKYELR